MTRRGADNDLLDATRKLPELAAGRQPELRALDAGAAQEPAGARVHPPLHAGADGLVPRLRPGDAPTTTPTATSPASSRSSTPSRSPTTPRGGVLTPAGPRLDSSRACRPASPRAARAPPASRAADGSAPWTDDGNLGADDCDPSHALPARDMKRLATVAFLLAVAAAAMLDHRRGRRRRRLQGPRDLRQRRLHHHGRGRQGRRRQGRQDRLARRHAATTRRSWSSTSTTPASRTSAPTRTARSARSR